VNSLGVELTVPHFVIVARNLLLPVVMVVAQTLVVCPEITLQVVPPSEVRSHFHTAPAVTPEETVAVKVMAVPTGWLTVVPKLLEIEIYESDIA
jgi:hypothetical protein